MTSNQVNILLYIENHYSSVLNNPLSLLSVTNNFVHHLHRQRLQPSLRNSLSLSQICPSVLGKYPQFDPALQRIKKCSICLNTHLELGVSLQKATTNTVWCRLTQRPVAEAPSFRSRFVAHSKDIKGSCLSMSKISSS